MSSQKKKKLLNKNYLLNVNNYNETKNDYLLDKVLLDEAKKQTRGSGYRIYLDGTIEFYNKSGKYRMRVSNELRKWFYLPNNERERLSLLVDFHFKNKSGELIEVGNVVVAIFYKKIGKKKTDEGVFISPIGDSSKSELIRSQMKLGTQLTCIVSPNEFIKTTLRQTEHFKKCVETQLMNKIEINPRDLELIVAGEKRTQRFEIYRDEKGRVLIKLRVRMRYDGTIELSMSLSDYIKNWYENEEFIKCSLNKQKPVIKQAKNRMLGSFPIKAIRFSYYDKPKVVELFLISIDWKLTDKALNDYKIRKTLKLAGFKIDMIRTGIPYTKTHYNKELEKQLREMLNKSCEKNVDLSIYHEVEITNSHILGENTQGEKSIIDVLIIMRDRITNDIKLLLIELKTSIGKGRNVIIKEKLGELLHIRYKFREDERMIPILLYPTKFLTGNNKKLSESQGALLLNEDDLKDLMPNPKLLFFKVEQFQKNRSVQRNQTTKSIGSCKIAERYDLKFLLKQRELLEKTFPIDLSIIGTNKIKSKGSKFENEVQMELEKEGFEVLRNVEMIYSGKLFEIDLLAFKDDEIMIVECRDGSKLSKRNDINKHIRTKIALTELNMKLFNAHQARVYVKLEKLADEMHEKYGKIDWIKDFKIKIIKNK